MKVKQPKPEQPVINGFFAVQRGNWPIGVIESALHEAIASLDSNILSYTQPAQPYDKYDWQRMQDWVNWREAFKQCLRQLNPPKKRRKAR